MAEADRFAEPAQTRDLVSKHATALDSPDRLGRSPGVAQPTDRPGAMRYAVIGETGTLMDRLGEVDVGARGN